MATISKSEELSSRGIRVSKLSSDLRASITEMNIDTDGDGKIDEAELGTVINNLKSTKKDNKLLRNLVAVLVVFSLVLTGCVFGASIAAARLAKDTSVDSVSGIVYAKGTTTPIKVEPVSIHKDGVYIAGMTTDELDVLNEIVLNDGYIKFHVKGYAKSVGTNQVGLIVEGGSLIYGEEGLISATGVAETMLDLVYPPTDDAAENVRRLTASTTSTNSYTSNGVVSSARQPVNLYTAGNYAILSKAGVTTTGVTSVTGNIGTSPIAASSLTGFSNTLDSSGTFSTSGIVTGQITAADYTAPTPGTLTVATGDMLTAYNDAAGRVTPDSTELGAGNIEGLTLVPGLYKWTTNVGITSSLYFDGSDTDVWILQVAGSVNIAANAIMTLSGGAKAENIFWQVAGETTFGVSSENKGVFLCATKIVFQTSSSLIGAALANTAVTLDAATIVN